MATASIGSGSGGYGFGRATGLTGSNLSARSLQGRPPHRERRGGRGLGGPRPAAGPLPRPQRPPPAPERGPPRAQALPAPGAGPPPPPPAPPTGGELRR